jgi:hypothetical protein
MPFISGIEVTPLQYASMVEWEDQILRMGNMVRTQGPIMTENLVAMTKDPSLLQALKQELVPPARRALEAFIQGGYSRANFVVLAKDRKL